ncbi:hypothetical protein L249_0612 [Ophiocordyceps polyrhachis-furcata BCC 54312]|uniref:ATP-dependent DNA helicase CHL1 n=1 Tax=Ophiocordyceps polyrhachis-furcata BCC 54312 TaxID=1330021 RepID=A0A367LE49_9HYPO|nr:hypothetical protein L249_0612 [Ophiocordyceps polyrhachis-furcata BCC 54312]
MEPANEAAPCLDFHHPYTPYDVQVQLMRTVYQVLETGNGQIGILESPTGTGKSLSLICASLTWLRNHKSREHDAALEAASVAYQNEPSWLVEQLLRRKRDELVQEWEEREKRLEAARQKEEDFQQRPRKRQRKEDIVSPRLEAKDEDDAEWLIDDREDPDEGLDDALSGLSKESRQVLENFGLGQPRKTREDVEEMPGETIKIFYTSRTHSQLSQFIAELRRPSFPSSLPGTMAEERATTSERVKLLPLSSRQRLCINPAVARLRSTQAINDRCAELQQAKSGKKCSYVPNQELRNQTHRFRDAALAALPDIEDLYQLGKSLAVCPYYASRAALPAAEIVTLPYPLLLQKKAREALGIKLEGSVVIIDEAHNIMDAVSNVHAAELRFSELKRARSMLGVYVKRFGKRLKGENRISVGRLGRVIDGLTEWMERAKSLKEEAGTVTPSELSRHKGIDMLDMFGLIRYIQESRMAYKIEGYATHVEEGKDPTRKPSSTPALHSLVSFLAALTNTSDEGRFFYRKTSDDTVVSYLLLSPTHAFSSIADSARAVILAGGTMSPFDDYRNHLFPTLATSKLTTLSCGHVVPAENLCVWTLEGTRPGAAPFDFSYQHRGNQALMTELGLAMVNLCSVVPDGVVVFFPSYGYLEEMVRAWQGQPRIWDRLRSRKYVFKETRGCSGDDVLQQYSEAILNGESTRGAVLLSVVGGKMSEGINFSDRLGRCVVMVGMPYPNAASPEWKAKMEYIEATAKADGKQAARDFYDNACMRAVNQSIGRAIRHRGDYAAIVLADRRYASARIRARLPAWIRDATGTGEGAKGMLSGLMGALSPFFRRK